MPNAASKHRSEVRLVARAVVAAALAFFIAEALALPQSYWAVITALLVVQTSLGGTISAGLDRLLGTLAGAVLGAAVALAGSFLGVNQAIVLVVAVAPLTLLAALHPSFRLAPVTAAIVLLATPSNASPIASAVHRFGEIGLGTVIGIIVSTVVLPSRARRICSERSAEMLRLLGEVLSLHLQPSDPEKQQSIDRLNDRILAELGKIMTAAQEARRELAFPEGRAPAQDRLVRTMRRLRSDVAFVGRATASDDLDWRALGPRLGELGDAFRVAFDALSGALLSASCAPDLDALDGVIAKLLTAVSQEPRESRGAAVLPFILETLRRDLGDLVELVAPPPVGPAGIDQGAAT